MKRQDPTRLVEKIHEIDGDARETAEALLADGWYFTDDEFQMELMKSVKEMRRQGWLITAPTRKMVRR